MNVREFSFSAIIAATGTIVSCWLGGWDAALQALVALMVLDYITGFLGAVKNHSVDSEVMFWGGTRKGAILAVLVVAVLLDKLVGNAEPVIRTLAIYFYISREGVSVTENLGILGVPLPPGIANGSTPGEGGRKMKLFIDLGHGGRDPGTNVKIKESQYTLIYGLELGRVLKELGFEIMYSRTTDIDVSLSERCGMANAWGATYFISIHFNSGGGIGVETFALSAGGKGEWLANAVQSALIAYTGSINRGVKFANFQVLRDTNMPAILVEGGFVDSDSDSLKIQTEEYKRKFVQGATKGICAYTGVEWRDMYSTVTHQPVDKDIYLSVRVLQSKADQAIIDINKLGFACKVLPLA